MDLYSTRHAPRSVAFWRRNTLFSAQSPSTAVFHLYCGSQSIPAKRVPTAISTQEDVDPSKFRYLFLPSCDATDQITTRLRTEHVSRTCVIQSFVHCLYCSLCGLSIEEVRTQGLISIGWWTIEEEACETRDHPLHSLPADGIAWLNNMQLVFTSALNCLSFFTLVLYLESSTANKCIRCL